MYVYTIQEFILLVCVAMQGQMKEICMQLSDYFISELYLEVEDAVKSKIVIL